MAIVKITKDNFEQEVINGATPILVDFWAPWCGPCKMIGPLLEEIATEIQDVKIGKINIDEEMELATQFEVMSIPTLIVFKNGVATKKEIGAMPKEAILKMLG